MFGFLRRKKPAPEPAPTTDEARPPEAAAPEGGAPGAVATEAPGPKGAANESVAPEGFGAAAIEDPPAAEVAAAVPRADASIDASSPPASASPPVSVPTPAAAPEPAAPAPATAPEPEPVLEAAPPAPARAGWFARLRQGLSRTSSGIASVFVSVKVDEALYEELETALLTSDAGVDATYFVLERLRERVRRDRIGEADGVRRALRELLVEMLMPLEQPIDIDRAAPLVMMIAGVNGAGKTTSIGKLAHHLRREGKSVLLAAGDTFRAAAREQLAAWGERNEVTVIAQHGGDPAAVAFDAVSAGRARGTGVVIIDTAGRLPTQANLMDELRKIRRVVGKAMEGAPHESLLVLDGNTGQNMLGQVKAFDEAVALTGLVVTKLDGTAKGGALLALAHTRRERPIPVYFIGIGEGIDDLQAFSAQEFADALVGGRGNGR